MDNIPKNDSINFIFSNGIYGFEDHRQFVFINQTDDVNNPFRLMVSVNNPDTSFIVVPPTFVYSNYDIKIDDFDLKDLGVTDHHDIVVLCIVTLTKESLYVNLASPIILSLSSKRGKQIILDNSSYDIRYRVKLGE